MRDMYFLCCVIGVVFRVFGSAQAQPRLLLWNSETASVAYSSQRGSTLFVHPLIHPRPSSLFHSASTAPHRTITRWGRMAQAQEVPPDNTIISWAVGGTLATLITVPLVGNVYALASGHGNTNWGAIGLFAVGFLGGMSVYIAGTGGFFADKTYWYGTIPLWSLGLGVLGLGITNVVIGQQKKRASPLPPRSHQKRSAFPLHQTFYRTQQN